LGVAAAAIVGYYLVPLVGWRWVMVGSGATALLAVLIRRSTHLPDEARGQSVPMAKVSIIIMIMIITVIIIIVILLIILLLLLIIIIIIITTTTTTQIVPSSP
jgi:hypothetical protein